MSSFTDAQKRQLAMLVGANRVLWMDRHPSTESEERAWKLVSENMKLIMPQATAKLMKKEWSALKLQYYTMLVHSTMYEDSDSVEQHRFYNQMKFLGEKVPYSYRIEVIDTAPITTFTRNVSLPPSTKTIEAVKRKYGVLFSQAEAKAVRDEIARLDVETAIYDILGIGASPKKKQKITEEPTAPVDYKMSCVILSRLFQKHSTSTVKNPVLDELFGCQKKGNLATKVVEPGFDLDEAIRKASMISRTKKTEECVFTGRNTHSADMEDANRRAKLTEEDQNNGQGFDLDAALADVVREAKQANSECKARPSTSSISLFYLDAALRDATLSEEKTQPKEEKLKKRKPSGDIEGPKKNEAKEKVIEASPSRSRAESFDLDGAISEASRATITPKENDHVFRMVTSEELKLRSAMKYPDFDLDEELRAVGEEFKKIEVAATSTAFDLDEAIRTASVDNYELEGSIESQEDFQRAIKNGLNILDSQYLDPEQFEFSEPILYNSFDKEGADETEYFTDETQSIHETMDKDSETSSVDLSMLSCSTSVYIEEMEAMRK